MSEKPTVYRSHGGKVLQASFPKGSLKLDGDLASYASAEKKQSAARILMETKQFGFRTPDSGPESE